MGYFAQQDIDEREAYDYQQQQDEEMELAEFLYQMQRDEELQDKVNEQLRIASHEKHSISFS